MATIFKYPQGNYEFRDEDGAFTAAEVKQQLTQYFPELANATEEKKTEGADTIITFVKRAGTKGAEVLSDSDVLKLYHVVDLAQRAGTNAELPPDILSKLLDELTCARAYAGIEASNASR